MTHHNEEEDTLNDPAAKYSSTINIFQSHEEAADFEISQILQQKPLDRIRETVELILRVYGHTQESLRARTPGNKITFLSGI